MPLRSFVPVTNAAGARQSIAYRLFFHLQEFSRNFQQRGLAKAMEVVMLHSRLPLGDSGAAVSFSDCWSLASGRGRTRGREASRRQRTPGATTRIVIFFFCPCFADCKEHTLQVSRLGTGSVAVWWRKVIRLL